MKEITFYDEKNRLAEWLTSLGKQHEKYQPVYQSDSVNAEVLFDDSKRGEFFNDYNFSEPEIKSVEKAIECIKLILNKNPLIWSAFETSEFLYSLGSKFWNSVWKLKEQKFTASRIFYLIEKDAIIFENIVTSVSNRNVIISAVEWICNPLKWSSNSLYDWIYSMGKSFVNLADMLKTEKKDGEWLVYSTDSTNKNFFENEFVKIRIFLELLKLGYVPNWSFDDSIFTPPDFETNSDFNLKLNLMVDLNKSQNSKINLEKLTKKSINPTNNSNKQNENGYSISKVKEKFEEYFLKDLFRLKKQLEDCSNYKELRNIISEWNTILNVKFKVSSNNLQENLNSKKTAFSIPKIENFQQRSIFNQIPILQQGIPSILQTGIPPNFQNGISPNFQMGISPNFQTGISPNFQMGISPILQQNIQPGISYWQQINPPNRQAIIPPKSSAEFFPKLKKNSSIFQPKLSGNFEKIKPKIIIKNNEILKEKIKIESDFEFLKTKQKNEENKENDENQQILPKIKEHNLVKKILKKIDDKVDVLILGEFDLIFSKTLCKKLLKEYESIVLGNLNLKILCHTEKDDSLFEENEDASASLFELECLHSNVEIIFWDPLKSEDQFEKYIHSVSSIDFDYVVHCPSNSLEETPEEFLANLDKLLNKEYKLWSFWKKDVSLKDLKMASEKTEFSKNWEKALIGFEFERSYLGDFWYTTRKKP